MAVSKYIIYLLDQYGYGYPLDPITISEGETKNLPKNGSAMPEAHFVGWTATMGGSDVDFEDGESVSFEEIQDRFGTSSWIVRIYAILEDGFSIQIDNDESIGTLSLTDEDGNVICTSSGNGKLYYGCAAGETYVVKCSISNPLYKYATINGNAMPYMIVNAPVSEQLIGNSVYVMHDLFTVNCSSDSHGTASIETPDHDGKYRTRDISVSITSNEGYDPSKFIVYSADGDTVLLEQTINAGSTSFTIPMSAVNQDISVVVSFALKRYSFTIKSNNRMYGRVSSSADLSKGVEHGSSVTISASYDSDVADFTGWFRDGEESPAYTSSSFSKSVTESENLTAVFVPKSNHKQTVCLGYTNGSSSTNGTLRIGEKEFAGGGTASVFSGEFEYGEYVYVSVSVKPGSRFVGFFSDSNGTTPFGTGDNTIPLIRIRPHETAIPFSVTIYAKFASEGGSVMEWEGSSTNKMMTWRSKTYAASRPFCPSACRVDTLGYPVEKLTVDMFSSPDSEAKTTGHAELTNIASQDSRRLPIRRPERFMQVEVKSDDEVDAVYIGTSMGGLAV